MRAPFQAGGRGVTAQRSEYQSHRLVVPHETAFLTAKRSPSPPSVNVQLPAEAARALTGTDQAGWVVREEKKGSKRKGGKDRGENGGKKGLAVQFYQLYASVNGSGTSSNSSRSSRLTAGGSFSTSSSSSSSSREQTTRLVGTFCTSARSAQRDPLLSYVCARPGCLVECFYNTDRPLLVSSAASPGGSGGAGGSAVVGAGGEWRLVTGGWEPVRLVPIGHRKHPTSMKKAAQLRTEAEDEAREEEVLSAAAGDGRGSGGRVSILLPRRVSRAALLHGLE